MALNSYKSYVNQASELKSHSSALTNERINAINAAIDSALLNARDSNKQETIHRLFDLVHLLWINARCLVRYFPPVRMHLSLDTKQDGVYTLDVLDSIIDRQLYLFKAEPKKYYTHKKRYTVIKRIEYMYLLLSDVFQFFKFKFRTDNNQKPDIFQTAEADFIPDENTLNQFSEIVGNNTKIDFERLRQKIAGRNSVSKLLGEQPEEEMDDMEDFEEDEAEEEDDN